MGEQEVSAEEAIRDAQEEVQKVVNRVMNQKTFEIVKDHEDLIRDPQRLERFYDLIEDEEYKEASRVLRKEGFGTEMVMVGPQQVVWLTYQENYLGVIWPDIEAEDMDEVEEELREIYKNEDEDDDG